MQIHTVTNDQERNHANSEILSLIHTALESVGEAGSLATLVCEYEMRRKLEGASSLEAVAGAGGLMGQLSGVVALLQDVQKLLYGPGPENLTAFLHEVFANE